VFTALLQAELSALRKKQAFSRQHSGKSHLPRLFAES